jgi:hypothetical protein
MQTQWSEVTGDMWGLVQTRQLTTTETIYLDTLEYIPLFPELREEEGKVL